MNNIFEQIQPLFVKPSTTATVKLSLLILGFENSVLWLESFLLGFD